MLMFEQHGIFVSQSKEMTKKDCHCLEIRNDVNER